MNNETLKEINLIRQDFLKNPTSSNAIHFINCLMLSSSDIQEHIDDSEYWPDVSNLLKTLLAHIPIEELLEKHQLLLLNVINKAPQTLIVEVNKYLKCYAISNRDKFIDKSRAVLIALTRRLRGVLCFEELAKLLCYFVEVPEVILELETQLKEAENDSEKRFRVYEVIYTTLSLENFSNFSVIRSIIDMLIKEIDSNDLLMCITALEFLAQITAQRHKNAEFFNSIGLLQHTYELLLKQKASVDGGLLYSAYLRFFGKLCAVEPDVLTRFPLFADEVFDMAYHFDSLDIVKRQLAFETLTEITLTCEAKRFLASPQSPYNISKAMNHFGVAIALGPEECRVRLLEALTVMMSVPHFSRPSESDVENILCKMFIELGQPFTKLLSQYIQKPFADLQYASLSFLFALVKHKWSLELLLQEPNFLPTLLSRKHENDLKNAQLKYDIVVQIIETNSKIEPLILDQLKNYQSKGIYGDKQIAGSNITWESS